MKHRLQFVVDKKTLDDIDDLAELAGAQGRAAVIRRALKYYGWYARSIRDGFEVYMQKGDERFKVAVLS